MKKNELKVVEDYPLMYDRVQISEDGTEMVELIDGRKVPLSSVMNEDGSFMPMTGLTDISDKTETTKGGPGSGNFQHAGRPGKIGGSAPKDGADGIARGENPKSNYDKDKWNSIPDVGERKKQWSSQSQEERDAQAQAERSIAKEIRRRTGKPYPDTGDAERDISERTKQFKGFVSDESLETIESTALELDALLEASGADPVTRRKLSMMVVDTLVAQENESMSRQLGDHGISHIRGNIDMAMGILKEVPGADTPSQAATVYLSCVFHDTGYLAEPAMHSFLDEDHPRWSRQHYDENVRPLVKKALGSRAANNISTIIESHASTSIDWSADPVASAVRTADNMALFQKEKLPPLFKLVPSNIGVLEQLATGKIDLATAKSLMKKNISEAGFSAEIEKGLFKAIEEVNPRSPKFTLGMMGGEVVGFEWAGDHIKVMLKANKESTRLQKLLDLGQRQFAKLAETYGVKWTRFRSSLNFKFEKPPESGRVMLEAVMVGEDEALSGALTKQYRKQVKQIKKIWGR